MRVASYVLFALGALVAPVVFYRLVGRGRRPWLAFLALFAFLAGAYGSRLFFRGALGPALGGLLAVTVLGLVLYRRLGPLPRNMPSGAGRACAKCQNPIVVEASGRPCPACGRVFHNTCIADHVCRRA